MLLFLSVHQAGDIIAIVGLKDTTTGCLADMNETAPRK